MREICVRMDTNACMCALYTHTHTPPPHTHVQKCFLKCTPRFSSTTEPCPHLCVSVCLSCPPSHTHSH